VREATMPSTNGHGPKRAILYARVSTDEQAKNGYSLAQQLEALCEYASREGLQIIEEVEDPGQSGASLERPGMDHVRDLVSAGEVSVVLAQDRDRFSREPAYLYLLREEFASHGCTLRALNDRGDDSPEGQLTDGILDQIARFERLKIAERSRRGRQRKAREGKVLATHAPRYGFKLNATRDGYEVNETEMEVVRRIFHMVGVEGRSIRSVSTILEREGIPTPKGAKHWDRSFSRKCIEDDVYKPHTFEEVREVVSDEVSARLDPRRQYGLWWFNRRGLDIRQVSEPGPDGRRYRKTYRWYHKPKEEWIAVPMPISCIPRDLVEAARAAIKHNRRPARAGRRFWELTGGVAYCGECGQAVCATHSVKAKRGRTYAYDYYRCAVRNKYGRDACTNAQRPKADERELAVWEVVSGLLKDPSRLRAGLEELIEEERHALRGDPDQEIKAWAKKLAEVDRKRSAYQDQQAEGLITLEELRAKLSALEEARTVAQRELDVLRSRREHVEQLEHDADTILEHYAGMVPEALDALTSEERHRVYKMLRLKVLLHADGSTEITGTFGGQVEAPGPGSVETEGSSKVCPHGRTIAKRIRLADLLREFGRA
jgi:site-specific DNA recombinase